LISEIYNQGDNKVVNFRKTSEIIPKKRMLYAQSIGKYSTTEQVSPPKYPQIHAQIYKSGDSGDIGGIFPIIQERIALGVLESIRG
jgi:hypothetical protein